MGSAAANYANSRDYCSSSTQYTHSSTPQQSVFDSYELKVRPRKEINRERQQLFDSDNDSDSDSDSDSNYSTKIESMPYMLKVQ